MCEIGKDSLKNKGFMNIQVETCLNPKFCLFTVTFTWSNTIIIEKKLPFKHISLLRYSIFNIIAYIKLT